MRTQQVVSPIYLRPWYDPTADVSSWDALCVVCQAEVTIVDGPPRRVVIDIAHERTYTASGADADAAQAQLCQMLAPHNIDGTCLPCKTLPPHGGVPVYEDVVTLIRVC